MWTDLDTSYMWQQDTLAGYLHHGQLSNTARLGILMHNSLELGVSLKTRWENFFCRALAMIAAGSLSGMLGSLWRGLRGVPPGDLDGVQQK